MLLWPNHDLFQKRSFFHTGLSQGLDANKLSNVAPSDKETVGSACAETPPLTKEHRKKKQKKGKERERFQEIRRVCIFHSNLGCF